VPRMVSGDRRSGCPISLALELIGDPWTLLVVRDLMFKGLKTFRDFERAGEGIATNVLSDRLSRLEAARIVVKKRDPDDGRRFVYRLTRKGIDLAPMLTDLVVWSDQYADTDAPRAEIREMRDHRARFLKNVGEKWRRGER
jgi:DNA-binding HxlR family transcriptional regulator